MKRGARFRVMRCARLIGRTAGRRHVSVAYYAYTLADALDRARAYRERDAGDPFWKGGAMYWIAETRAHRKLVPLATTG